MADKSHPLTDEKLEEIEKRLTDTNSRKRNWKNCEISKTMKRKVE